MKIIIPNWPAPSNVHAATTTREQGVSPAPYASFNVGDHVGDHSNNVAQNRQSLMQHLQIKAPPIWMNQIHSTHVVNIDQEWPSPPEADAAIATQAHRVCVVMTADCLPILLCNRSGTKVAAIHAGWRGLAGGIIAQTIKQLQESQEFNDDFIAWLGPAIGPDAFEVGQDVFDTFVNQHPDAEQAFTHKEHGDKWFANLYLLARQQLSAHGILECFGGEFCTYSDENLFFSYRRDQGITGRMATLIWLSA